MQHGARPFPGFLGSSPSPRPVSRSTATRLETATRASPTMQPGTRSRRSLAPTHGSSSTICFLDSESRGRRKDPTGDNDDVTATGDRRSRRPTMRVEELVGFRMFDERGSHSLCGRASRCRSLKPPSRRRPRNSPGTASRTGTRPGSGVLSLTEALLFPPIDLVVRDAAWLPIAIVALAPPLCARTSPTPRRLQPTPGELRQCHRGRPPAATCLRTRPSLLGEMPHTTEPPPRPQYRCRPTQLPPADLVSRIRS